MAGPREARLAALRGQIAAIQAGTRTPTPVLPFGDLAIDGCFPGGGLPLGGWHEVAGAGLEDETGAATAAFVGLLLRPLVRTGAIVWVARRNDLFAPGLFGLGFPADRLIQVRTRDEAETLSVLEDALSTQGVAAAVGEAEAPDLTAGRRLQLACEKRGGLGVVLHRRPYGGRTGKTQAVSGSASFSRWRIGPSPTPPPPDDIGLGPPRWRVELERCRGGRAGAWILEAQEAGHGPHPFRLVSQLADHDVAPAEPGLRRVG
ncbi:protein imuA [Caulobacter sp.]|uniref:ImuA family protein n=1 Tax=Caulobacter sp. TaxID=78 RepID=UPI001B224684|nr:protein imuA [Caulobacter sp.]MBO9547590.1 protein imuA [Caulobacter sp.]